MLKWDNMYIFVTYGVKGWRGVQERGLAVAKHFNKKKVLFLNGYDSSFIRKQGFKCRTIDLSLSDPKKIKFPKNTKALIFADLPTNELFNISLLLAATEKKVPVVVFDQIYRRGQLKEGVYKNLIKYSDLLILNGLNFLKKEEIKGVKIIPPLARYKSQPKIKEELSQKYGLDPKKFWIFVSGYFKPVYEMLKKANPALSRESKNFNLIICGANLQKPKKSKNQLLLPYLPQKEFLGFLNASDLFVSKFGYLQILEALALRTPIIVAGKAGVVLKMEILDKKLQEVIKYAKDSKELYRSVFTFLKNKKERKNISNKIAKLHNLGFDGAKIAADYIKKIKKSKAKKVFKKRILILVNNEVKKAEKLIKNQDFLYVLGIIAPVSKPGPKLYPVKKCNEKILSRKLKDLLLEQPEILPHSFKEIYLFSQRKYDGLMNILPWYNLWIEKQTSLFKLADEILITSQGKYLLFNLLEPFLNKTKTIKIQ